ncbi:MAG: C39 family peptidase [Vulcanibacillus sp.]
MNFFKKKDLIINNSTDKKYLTQRDNVIRPLETCTPTSVVMALTYSGIQTPLSKNQLEDDFITFMNTDSRVIDFYKNNPENWIRQLYIKKVPANEIHVVVAYSANLWVNQEKIVRFTSTASLRNILQHLFIGNCCVVSGKWPYLNKNNEKIFIDHVVCVVGFKTTQTKIKNREIDIEKVTDIIIDDPFGNYQTLYEDHNGNDIYMPINDFNSIVKDVNRLTKWCYFIGYDDMVHPR